MANNAYGLHKKFKTPVRGLSAGDSRGPRSLENGYQVGRIVAEHRMLFHNLRKPYVLWGYIIDKCLDIIPLRIKALGRKIVKYCLGSQTVFFHGRSALALIRCLYWEDFMALGILSGC